MILDKREFGLFSSPRFFVEVCVIINGMKEYVEKRNGGYYIKGKRVSLDSIVYSLRRGQSPKSTQESFPTLTLEEVYGGLAFYFANQEAVDAAILEDELGFERDLAASKKANPEWYRKMDLARQARKEALLEKA